MRRSARDERGAAIILVSLSLVVLGMACAMAVDLGNVAQLHRHAQNTVDDAAISGADLLEKGTDSLNQIVGATEAYIEENWGGLQVAAWGTCPSIPSGFAVPAGSAENCVTFNGASTATATAINVELPPQSVPFTVARLGGFMSGTVEASASAVVVPGTSPCALCVLGTSGLTLDDTGSGTFTVSGTGGGAQAGIVVNSPGTPAAEINGSGTIAAPQIDVTGTYDVKHSGTFQPAPITGTTPVPDPLGNLVAPTPASSTIPSQAYSSNANGGILPSGTYGSVSIGGSGSVTIPPGSYSNINVTGSATLTLESGTYFITGAFTVGGTGSASVIEDGGVLLYFTCSSGSQIAACASGGQSGGSLGLSGTGNMALAPMTTGPYANLTVFYDRNDNAAMTLSGTPGLSFSGTVYAKSSALALNGTGSTLSSLIIVRSATISGNGSIGVSYDASENAAVPGAPYLCSTAANNC
jgi:Flp pilus assembly protein TadG